MGTQSVMVVHQSTIVVQLAMVAKVVKVVKMVKMLT
jgi:hypothetical protein